MKVLAALVLCVASVASAQTPDLVVVISIDQFPYEYIERFRPYFGEGGFNRFLNGGANFTEAWYPYAATVTGAGHATIGTGLMPSRSGIINNEWYDRTTDTMRYCVEDRRVAATGGKTGGMSPVTLAEDSLGDRLLEKSPQSKVIAVAIKDRSSILMGGRKATAAYWFDPTLPGFVSSTYYRHNPAVLAYNAKLNAFLEANRTWTMSNYIPPDDLARITYDPPELRKFKSDRAGLGVSFPHPVKDLPALTYTPFGNDMVLGLARHVIETESLGTDDGSPDLLYIGLSSPDYLGHNFGPDSLEAADTVVRTDRSLATFVSEVANRTTDLTFAITADHGVQAIPEVARARGREAGRINLREPSQKAQTLADLTADRLWLEKRAATKLKLKVSDMTPIGDRLLLVVNEPSIYLNWERIRRAKLDPETVKRAARDAAREMTGVSAAFTSTELMIDNPDSGTVETALRNSFRADRTGDVLIAFKPGYISDYSGTGTTHGQPVEADQHVLLMLWGTGVRKCEHTGRVAPNDLAKTLGTLLGVTAGDAQSNVLPCTVSAPRPAATAAERGNN